MLDRLLDFIWPRRCELCGRPVDRRGRHVCADCVNRLPFIPTRGCCKRCGRDAVGLDAEFECEECKAFKPSYDRVASVMRMDGAAREMLNAYKFRYHYWLRDDLVEWMAAAVNARFRADEIDVVLAVPLTWKRLLNRGYNQCRVLAKPLAKILGKPCPPFVMKRVNAPRQQARLSEEERRKNVVGTFAVRRPEVVRGKVVLVVDDVMTTGSTLSECARVLKKAGASKVYCVSFVRSLKT